MARYITINGADNVAVALDALTKGEHVMVRDRAVVLAEDIPAGHKFAVEPIAKGDKVLKYGFAIGNAQSDIAPGQWVHTHNVKTGLGDVLSYTYQPNLVPLPQRKPSTFNGYRRKDGQVGVRNEVWIVPTVGCVNSIADQLARNAASYANEKQIDGVFSFPHPYGCSQMGDDQEYTQKILAGMVHHPNAGAVLILGLGCENNNITEFRKVLGEVDGERVRYLECQATEDEFADGQAILHELIDYAAQFTREPVDASELIVGLKCGGSDGLSGITANPLVGRFSDILVASGGTAILTEVPEMFGAETILMNRCRSEAVFDKTVRLINEFKDYYSRHNQVIYENPSPGNKKGGITTLEDKSLGCIQKGGTAEVTDVLDYGERTLTKGLNLLQGPGNDLVAATALVASGAHIVLFTTGRGTPFGSPAPTVKISSNTALATQKRSWIDFNAGVLAEGADFDEVGEQFFDYIIEVASGKQVRAEINGCRDFAIFKSGVTL